MTKKDIYKLYNIEYQNGKIKAPNGEFINPLLKTGNGKTGKSIFTYSQLAGARIWSTAYGEIKGTCAGNCPNCYACTGRYNMDNVKDCNALHTLITRSYIDFKKRAIIAQIKADHISIVRVHASGDFDSIEDVKAWLEISAACPDTFFYTYTKRPWQEIEVLNKCHNFNIVPSLICGRVNFGPCSELLELKAMVPNSYICPCGFDDSMHCENCKACATKEHVIFLLHSTPDYNGPDDPLYSELKKMVFNQEA